MKRVQEHVFWRSIVNLGIIAWSIWGIKQLGQRRLKFLARNIISPSLKGTNKADMVGKRKLFVLRPKRNLLVEENQKFRAKDGKNSQQPK